MLRPVKYVDFSSDGLGSYQIGFLWHVSRSIYLAIVVDGLFDRYLGRGLLV
jgi:hypothetical protein